VAGSERYWVGEIAGGAPAQRDRPAEFRTEKVDGAALQARLDASLSHSRATLARLTLADLETRRPAMDRTEVTVAWALLHSLEHVATHLGQMQMTRRMWEQQNQA
ncbi:MAG: DinB family protein, partial [Anaerolineales bacterium]|nr:DinB family protein [Anaerolineales bacterium]